MARIRQKDSDTWSAHAACEYEEVNRELHDDFSANSQYEIGH